jgi:LytTr DNA-binding domain
MQADAQASLETRNAEQAPHAADTSPGVVVGEREHRLYVLKPEKVDWIESQGNYVKFRCRGAEYISRDSIKRLAAVLADDGFIRFALSTTPSGWVAAFTALRCSRGQCCVLIHGTVRRYSGCYR